MRPGDLATRCRVSERSIFRDLQMLQAMGLPVYFDRGYQLSSPAFLPALYLTGEEALALRVAAGRGAELEGPMAQALLSAQCKLALRLNSASPLSLSSGPASTHCGWPSLYGTPSLRPLPRVSPPSRRGEPR